MCRIYHADDLAFYLIGASPSQKTPRSLYSLLKAASDIDRLISAAYQTTSASSSCQCKLLIVSWRLVRAKPKRFFQFESTAFSFQPSGSNQYSGPFEQHGETKSAWIRLADAVLAIRICQLFREAKCVCIQWSELLQRMVSSTRPPRTKR